MDVTEPCQLFDAGAEAGQRIGLVDGRVGIVLAEVHVVQGAADVTAAGAEVLGAGFGRSQSGVKLPLLSVHVRVEFSTAGSPGCWRAPSCRCPPGRSGQCWP